MEESPIFWSPELPAFFRHLGWSFKLWTKEETRGMVPRGCRCGLWILGIPNCEAYNLTWGLEARIMVEQLSWPKIICGSEGLKCMLITIWWFMNLFHFIEEDNLGVCPIGQTHILWICIIIPCTTITCLYIYTVFFMNSISLSSGCIIRQWIHSGGFLKWVLPPSHQFLDGMFHCKTIHFGVPPLAGNLPTSDLLPTR